MLGFRSQTFRNIQIYTELPSARYAYITQQINYEILSYIQNVQSFKQVVCYLQFLNIEGFEIYLYKRNYESVEWKFTVNVIFYQFIFQVFYNQQYFTQIIEKYLTKMHTNQAISLVVNILMGISTFFLTRLVTHEHQRLTPTSIYRFEAFIAIHIYIICMMAWFMMISETYEYVRWTFCLTLFPSLLMVTIEVIVYTKFTMDYQFQPYIPQPLEMVYLNCYFLILMYSLIGSFLSGVFITLTKIFSTLRKRRIANAMKKSVKPIPYQQKLSDKQCTICLFEFKEQDNDSILMIKCSHIFHKNCLLEWIKVNQSCPVCRYNIFEALNEEQREDLNIAGN